MVADRRMNSFGKGHSWGNSPEPESGGKGCGKMTRCRAVEAVAWGEEEEVRLKQAIDLREKRARKKEESCKILSPPREKQKARGECHVFNFPS